MEWEDVANTFTVIGGIASVVSAVNSFRRLKELQEINKKLSSVISVQYMILEAIENLGVKIQQTVKMAFSEDVRLELKAYHSQFERLCKALSEDLTFPDSDYNYKERLGELTQRTEILTEKLSS